MPKKKELFSQNIKELENIASQLNSGNIEIEDAVTLYKKGKTLLTSMKKYLTKIEKEIEIVEETFPDK